MKVKDVAKQLDQDIPQNLRKLLNKQPMTEGELADALDCSPARVKKALKALQDQRVNIEVRADGRYDIHATPEVGGRVEHTIKERGDGWQVFGATADNHLCSKYERLDVLNKLYDIYAAEGVTTVYNSGNWIDGEARFNKRELKVFGMDGQLDYMIDKYPQRKGITTHYVAGDDHEGWYAQRETVDIGGYLQMRAEKAGRKDLKYLGYIEHDIALKHGTGEAVLRVKHGGGGSAYALSYTSQKQVESYQGGEKPHIELIGHYHKFDWCVPLRSEILTCSGWKRHDELLIGETVLGYNVETDRCEWTPVLGINYVPQQEVVRYQNTVFSVDCTRNHKWALMKKCSDKAILGTIDETPCQPRIVQSAMAPDGPGLGTLPKAELLNRPDAVNVVLRMTSQERQAFIVGMLYGEGTIAGGGAVLFAQNRGPVADAFRLACQLEGRTTSTGHKATGSNAHITAVLEGRFRETRCMKEAQTSVEDVWCPTTGLGTWVMRQDDTITITGNCYPREVHTIQVGCTQDQSAFMRKKRIQAMVGGCICWFKQDAHGAIERFRVEWIPYYDRGYYARHFE